MRLSRMFNLPDRMLLHACNALPDPKADRGECGDEFECACLQNETGHENHGC